MSLIRTSYNLGYLAACKYMYCLSSLSTPPLALPLAIPLAITICHLLFAPLPLCSFAPFANMFPAA